MTANQTRVGEGKQIFCNADRAMSKFGDRLAGKRDANIPLSYSGFAGPFEEKTMIAEKIHEGFDVFLHDGDKAVGAVRRAPTAGKPDILIYVENAGDFVVPLTAVKEVYAEKVVLNRGLLSLELKQALGHAHDVEDPNI